ncbi:MAG: hypothetical protein R6U93_00435 [Dehalococcoidia bacterium]
MMGADLLNTAIGAFIAFLPIVIIGGLVWFFLRLREQRRLVGNPAALAATLVARSEQILRNAKRTANRHLSAAGHSEPPGFESELRMFWWFALDYWLKQDALREPFHTHLAEVSGRDHPAVLDRFDAYGQAVNEAKGDTTAAFMGVGNKLAEFSGIPRSIAWILSPELFTKAGELVLQEKKALKL